jgi:hypothetical protein
MGLEKKMQSSKETEITGMEDQNLCYLRLLQKLYKQEMKPVLKNTQEKTFPETLEIPNTVANSVVGGKYLLQTSTKGFIMYAKMT